MKFEETKLSGAFVIDLEKNEDERGFFARSFCVKEFGYLGIVNEITQANISYNKFAGTLRGLHYQVAPALETKIVRCIKGSIFDVIIDLRKGSDTYLQHVSVELNAQNKRSLIVPANFAHGFQTLENETEVMYMVSGSYNPDYERGMRYNDPILSLEWPINEAHISDKDKQWPLFVAEKF